ncbi:flavodoxin family protein [Methanosphaera cuniculi]|uniref:flavodoxin family protein n=1 Tax=Methanosphaera cuniculi TaxID=1077256 RepID=UPI0026DD605C|nr:flavodoxin [Methanosphaera cuniculi]
MTDLVVYYTRTNKTKMVAEKIAQMKNADMLEIIDKKDRSGALGYIGGAISAVRNSSTPIEYDVKDLSKYDIVYLGSPVWASKPAPAIREYIEQNDFSNVNVVTFVTMMASGEKPALEIMNDMIQKQGGNVIKSFAIITKNTDIDELTQKAIEEL